MSEDIIDIFVPYALKLLESKTTYGFKIYFCLTMNKFTFCSAKTYNDRYSYE